MAGGAGWVHIPWYATVWRADGLEEALLGIAPVAMRYGATEWSLYRSRTDRYKFSQYAYFKTELEWEAYWDGDEFNRFRRECSGWYQVPVVYDWTDRLATGALDPELVEE
jgi:hypothetical protein